LTVHAAALCHPRFPAKKAQSLSGRGALALALILLNCERRPAAIEGIFINS
jgi:hypothetical protein